MIAVVDNYDSFTWNLVDILKRGKSPVEVHLNDSISTTEFFATRPEGILVSPGPGRPKDSGISPQVFAQLPASMPFLGVCLGFQLMGEALGMGLIQGNEPVHGKVSMIHHDGIGIFAGMPNPFPAMRYHSLILDQTSLPDSLEVSAWTEDNVIMGLRHKTNPWYGLQFHPESILTERGALLVQNWMKVVHESKG